MKYKLLGKSGLRVSSLCLGTMGFMDGLNWGTTKQESRQVFDAFMDAGGNFIDTANTYGDGASEAFLGEFMQGDRHRVVLSTKYTGRFVNGQENRDANLAGSHRKSMVRAVEESLKRLKTDYIDLLWVHSWDFMTPVEEVMRALDDLVRQGKILYTGVSNAPAWIIAQANTLAMLRGWTPFVGVQVEYSLLERDAERDLLPMARAFDIGVTAWTPLASGWLTGKYRENGKHHPANDAPRRLDDPIMGRFVQRTEKNATIVEEVVGIANELGCTPAQVALNWVRRQGGIPIFGARAAEQVQENMDCVAYDLTEEHLRRLNEVSRINLGYPHAFLASTIVKNFVYGGLYDHIENHRETLLHSR